MPGPLQWNFQYSVGVPCDSFTLLFPWFGDLPVSVELWSDFYAEEEGTRVFSGVIDECLCSLGQSGAHIEVTGRGYGARLLDNEAVGQDYLTATLEDILKDHVRPYGVEVGQRVSLPSVSPFQVDSGTSAWGVLYDFCQYYGDIMPRFNREGQLILAPWGKQVQLEVNDRTAVTSLTHRVKRYGVCSQVLVRDRVTKLVSTVADSGLMSQGYVAQQVVTMPGQSTSQAMRFDGSHRLAQSQAERLRVELVVPSLNYLDPGCLVEVNRTDWMGNGTYVLVEAEVGVSEKGAYTRMELGDPDMTL